MRVRAIRDVFSALRVPATVTGPRWSAGASEPSVVPVREAECLGACGFATPILVGDDFIESVTPEKVSGILQRYA
mgnify:CR=1 FL=1